MEMGCERKAEGARSIVEATRLQGLHIYIVMCRICLEAARILAGAKCDFVKKCGRLLSATGRTI